MVNPTAVVLVALATVVGFIVGAPLIGLALGLAIVLIASTV